MTTPAQSTQVDGSRYYMWPLTGETFPSVTTIINSLSKPALVNWASKQAAEYAVSNWKQVMQTILAQGPTEAVKQISGAHRRTLDDSSAIGTHVHANVQASIEGRDMLIPHPEHMRFFEAWKLVYKPEFVLCEATVYNRAVGYAGTLDFMARIDGVNTIVDVKTGKNIYPEVALQLAAYANGEFIGAQDGDNYVELPMPPIGAAGVLHLRMTGYRWIPVRIDSEIFTAFRHVHQAWMWQQYLSKTVLNQNGQS